MHKLMVVSGGSRGLGLALVEQALQAGWQVLELSRIGATVEHTLYQHLKLDLAQLGQAMPQLEQRLAELAKQQWQQVALINNAGMVGPISPIALLDDAALLQNMAVNFSSGIRLMAAFVRHFQAVSAEKILISVSSGAALKGYPSWALYCAAKAGLENFVRSVAAEQEGQAEPICCVNFGPGVIDTDMQAEIRSSPEAMFRDVERFRQLKQSQQLRSPGNVAQAVLKLLQSKPENGRRYVVEEFDQ